MKILLLACGFMAFYFVGKYLGYRKAEKDMKAKVLELVALALEEKRNSQSDLDHKSDGLDHQDQPKVDEIEERRPAH